MSQSINEPSVVRREYATEERFLARRLSTWAELDGPLVEDVALAALLRSEPRRVLEVGCGTGDFTERVRDALTGDLVAVDLSERMVALTKARGIDARLADIEQLPFPDRTFDAVLANRVLYHLPDLDRGLREITRVLRPGGRLVAVTYSERHLEELNTVLNRPTVDSTFSCETSATAMARHFPRVDRQDVSGAAIFRTNEALQGFASQQFGVADAVIPANLTDLPTPLVARYHHCVVIGETER